MHFFELKSFQHVILFIFPTLIFMILFGLALGRTHLWTKNSEAKKKAVSHVFPTGIQDGRGPFPFVIALIIAGFLIWAIFYTLTIGIVGVKI